MKAITKDISKLKENENDIRVIISNINKELENGNFMDIIKSVQLKLEEKNDRLLNTMERISEFYRNNNLEIGELNLFSTEEHDKVNKEANRLIEQLTKELDNERDKKQLNKEDCYEILGRVKEGTNDTGWQRRLSNIGSTGTDKMLKQMINIIMLDTYNRKTKEDKGLHIIIDENSMVAGHHDKALVDFANRRNISIFGATPQTENVDSYKYIYKLHKRGENTEIYKLLKKLI